MSAPIPTFSDRPKAAPTPKLRALVKFPGNIVGGTGIDVTKQNGTVTIDMQWNEFGLQSAIPTSPTNNILTFDTATQAYVLCPSHLLGGAVAGIADAPNDGTQYGRQSGAWTPVLSGGLSDAPSDGTQYGRKNAAWTAVTSLPDAPSDGTQYGRKNGAWTVVPSAGISDAPSDSTLYGRKNGNWISVPSATLTTPLGDYANRAAVIAANIPASVTYLRIAGYTTAGDLGAALYKKVVSAPAHNGKIQSADGAWWEIAERTLTVQMFGGAADNSTDNVTPLLNALGAGGNYPCVYFPRGIYRFASAVNFTMPAVSQSALSIFGDGFDATELRWTSASNGIAIAGGSGDRSFHFHNLTLSTNQNGGGTAIIVSQSLGVGSSTITGVSIRGADGYGLSNYWNQGVELNNVNFFKLHNLFVGGSSSSAGTGVAISPGATGPTIVFNFVDCDFINLSSGILYGPYVQGVTVANCNFTNVINGIYVLAGSTGQDQLSVVGCQFGMLAGSGGNAIVVLGKLRDINITGSLFLFGSGVGSIYIQDGLLISIHGNNFSSDGTGIGINVVANDSVGGGPITGNTFYNMATGVNLVVGTNGWNVQANRYIAVSTQVSNGSGGANQVGVATE